MPPAWAVYLVRTALDGGAVGASVGVDVGGRDGRCVGVDVGSDVGVAVGLSDGMKVGCSVATVGLVDGGLVGRTFVGMCVRGGTGATVLGLCFPRQAFSKASSFFLPNLCVVKHFLHGAESFGRSVFLNSG